MKHFLASMLFTACLLAGCASAHYTAHPGSVNLFDSQSYDTLVVAHAVIESTKTDLAADKFPPAIAPGIKTAINALVTAYNVADTSYQVYHTAAVAGGATPAQTASLQSAISGLNTATVNLTTAKGGQ